MRSNLDEVLSNVKPKIKNNRINDLLTTRPNISIKVYNETSRYYARKQYEENIESNPLVPHGFYTTLENELETNGFVKTLKKYKPQIEAITKIMHIEKSTLISLLKTLQKPNSIDTLEQLKSRQDLKEIIKKYTAKYKEEYIAGLIKEKNELLSENTYTKDNSSPSYLLKIETFADNVLSNPEVTESLLTIVQLKLGFAIDKYQLKELLQATLEKKYPKKYLSILGIEKPANYQTYISNKVLKRLKKNYQNKLNQLFENESVKVKESIIEIIEMKKQLKELSDLDDLELKAKKIIKDKIKNLKENFPKLSFLILEEISAISFRKDIFITLNSDNLFEFKCLDELTPSMIKDNKEYELKLAQIKSVHNIILSLYNKQNQALLDLSKDVTSPLSISESSYEIDTSKWLNEDKILKLASKVNEEKINLLSENEFELLKKYLVEDGLLWAYIVDNIDIDTLVKIIDNWKMITLTYSPEEITIKNLIEIIKTVNINNYLNDLIIGLVGQEVATKVINYNQFSGVKITDDMISQRLKKMVDLAVRSEYVTKSSLPYECDVAYKKYKLQRYHNNDPKIFTSGVDTKTCFFISVNENDFFFYSLLNKNGFVLKIVDQNNNLVARATCFRKNNVFLINGIRLKNNKTLPNNLEEKQEFMDVIDLIKIFAQKLIILTENDECPIDYVICNKAGILENPEFEDKFEHVMPELFNTPINIYDDDWQEFVHTYDNKEQLLQEVPFAPNKSFSTDFGNYFPALLIYSRDNRAITSPKDISLSDQPATYTRPLKSTKKYIGQEITSEILARINRIKALSCFTGTIEEQKLKQENFELLKKENIKSIEINDNNYILTKQNNEIETVSAINPNNSFSEYTNSLELHIKTSR